MKLQKKHKILKHITVIYKVIAIIVFCLNHSFAQVSSSLDSTQIKIGSQFHLSIKVDAQKNDVVKFPEGKYFGQLEVLSSLPIDTVKNNNKLQLIKKYGLTQFDSGVYVIPKLKVDINNKEFRTDSLSIIVNDVKVDTTKQQMYDIKPIISVEKPMGNWWKWLLWLLSVLILASLFYWILKRVKFSVKEAKKNFASPIEKALAHLNELNKKQFIEKGEVKTYYSEMTDIARAYIEEMVEIPAMESTSNELFNALKKEISKRKLSITNNELQNFKKVLQTADLVKFAKSKPLPSEIEQDKQTIDKFVVIIDKALPRTEEEKQNLFKEELENQNRKQQNKKRLALTIGLTLALIVFSALTFMFTIGLDYLKENYIGYSTKSLLKKEWVTSAYGNPAIKVSTPIALTRFYDETIQNNLPPNVKSYSKFLYGSFIDDFSIVLSTTKFKDTTQVDLQIVLETNLQFLEAQGAKNMIVKTEEFKNQKGLSGLKSYGTCMIFHSIKQKDIKASYQMLVFAQAGGAQEVLMIHKENDTYAEEIIKKVQESIELAKAIP